MLRRVEFQELMMIKKSLAMAMVLAAVTYGAASGCQGASRESEPVTQGRLT
jgi:hypothetical protein